MRARIKEKRQVAKGTLLVVFDLQGEEVDFTPGQYFWVELLDPPYDDDKGPRRHITVVTSPTERGVLGLCTRLRDSAFKRSLAELEVGAEVEVEQPKGDYRLPEDTEQHYVFVAGGIGITVFRCMLRYIADTGKPYKVTLVYSNRDRESTAFLDELHELEQALPDLRLVVTMTDDPEWEGETRRIDAEMLRDHLGELDAFTYLVAGPPAMVEGVAGRAQRGGRARGAGAAQSLQRLLIAADLGGCADHDQRLARGSQPAQQRDQVGERQAHAPERRPARTGVQEDPRPPPGHDRVGVVADERKVPVGRRGA